MPANKSPNRMPARFMNQPVVERHDSAGRAPSPPLSRASCGNFRAIGPADILWQCLEEFGREQRRKAPGPITKRSSAKIRNRRHQSDRPAEPGHALFHVVARAERRNLSLSKVGNPSIYARRKIAGPWLQGMTNGLLFIQIAVSSLPACVIPPQKPTPPPPR
jgi:hypothetical protein